MVVFKGMLEGRGRLCAVGSDDLICWSIKGTGKELAIIKSRIFYIVWFQSRSFSSRFPLLNIIIAEPNHDGRAYREGVTMEAAELPEL